MKSQTTLQRKTLFIIGLTFFCLIAVLYCTSQIVVLSSFTDQEIQETRQNVERVQSAFTDNINSLEGTTRDWSLWDDTYAYIQDKNQDYFQSNLSGDAPMTSNRLNLMIFIDAQGRLVFAKAFDYRKGEPMPVPVSLRAHIYAGSPLLQHQNADSSIKGILSLPESPMLMASEPILPSAGTGEIGGTLIFGRFLDTDEIQHLAKTTLLGLKLQPLDDPQASVGSEGALSSLTHEPSVQVHALSATSIAGLALLKDVYGKPAFVLRAEMPRDVYARGQETIGFYMLTLVGTGAVFAVVILLFLQKLVLARLARLKRDVSAIGVNSDMSARVAMTGNDELAELADSINGMLSALQRSREEQKEGEDRYRAVIEQTSEAIFLVDAHTQRFLEANAASEILLGYSYEELMGMTLTDLNPNNSYHTSSARNKEAESERAGIRAQNMSTTGKLRLVVEQQYRRKNGTVVHVEVSDTHILSGGRQVLCIVARDITDRKRAEALLRDLAMRDGLTGLYNRREMQRILKEEAERFQRYGSSVQLIMIDIDHFKTVNDTYGHQVGDEVLRWVSHLISVMARPKDSVARYGGEELALIMPGATTEVAYELAEHIRQTIVSRPFQFVQDAKGTDTGADDNPPQILIPITISLGIASLPDNADCEDELIKLADNALYEAKSQGRNCTVIYDTIDKGSQLRLVR